MASKTTEQKSSIVITKNAPVAIPIKAATAAKSSNTQYVSPIIASCTIESNVESPKKELITFKIPEVAKLNKMERWFGRVALVTGASSNTGVAICKELLKYGIVVIACDDDLQSIRDVAEETDMQNTSGSLHAVHCNLKEEEEITAMFELIRENFGRFDICINNAANYFNASLLSGAANDWKTMFNVNVLALCICTKEAVKLMREFNIDDGQIIHINSLSSSKDQVPGSTFNSGTKFMVHGLTEGLRRELKALNSHIRVANISPGLVEADFASNYFTEQDEVAAMFNTIECLKPEDIAQTVVYILQSPPHVDVNEVILKSVEQAL